MDRPEAAVWDATNRELWSRVEQHDFEPDVALNFTQRLARDKDWTLAYTRAAILEYRRFCFLAVACPEMATPSEEVDEVWHQHLIYSRDYWEVWCRIALRVRLHHDPTAGGPVEQNRFAGQYAATLKRYEAFFGPPPEVFWPATRTRFAARSRFRTVDTHRRMVIWRPGALWGRGNDA